MGSLKKLVSVVALVYLLLAALFLLVPAVRTTVAEWGNGLSPTENERNFYQILSIIGFGVLAAQLLIDSLNTSLLSRTVKQQDAKINELKAKLYDHHQSTPPALATPTMPAPAVSYPTAAEAATVAAPRPEAPLQ